MGEMLRGSLNLGEGAFYPVPSGTAVPVTETRRQTRIEIGLRQGLIDARGGSPRYETEPPEGWSKEEWARSRCPCLGTTGTQDVARPARRGAGSGGFERNQEMRARVPAEPTRRSGRRRAAQHGDGIRRHTGAGAAR